MTNQIQQAIYVTTDIIEDGEVMARAGDIFHDGNRLFYFIVSERPTSYRMYTYSRLIEIIASGKQA